MTVLPPSTVNPRPWEIRTLSSGRSGSTLPEPRAERQVAPGGLPESLRTGGRGGRGEGLVEVDSEGRVAHMNRAAERLLGWSSKDLVGRPLLALTGARSGRALAHGSMLLKALHAGRRLRLDDAELVCKDRSLMPVTCVATPRVDDGTVTGTVLTFRGTADESAEPTPIRPVVTVLPAPLLDRAALECRLAQAIRTANQELQPLALLVLRLELPESQHTLAGRALDDLAWREATARIRRLVRPADIVARIGGDRFAVLMPGLEAASASRIAWAIVTALGRPLPQFAAHITAHVAEGSAAPAVNAGLALYPRDSGETLLGNAESALAAARQQRSGVTVYGSRTSDPSAVLAGWSALITNSA